MSDPIARIDAGRLTLEPFSDDYLTERYVGWLNDKTVTEHSRHRHQPQTLESCRAYAENQREAGNYFWAIVVKDGLGHIGNLSAYTDFPNRTADLTILIGEKAAWGKGYGAEAWIAACRWLFSNTRVEIITAGTLAANKGMVGIMKKAGMETRYEKNYTLSDGTVADAVLAVLLK